MDLSGCDPASLMVPESTNISKVKRALGSWDNICVCNRLMGSPLHHRISKVVMARFANITVRDSSRKGHDVPGPGGDQYEA